MFLYLCLFLLGAVSSVTALQAKCRMRLHKSSSKIGDIVFNINGTTQSMQFHIKGDPKIITEGYHGLHIHNNPVKRKDCSPAATEEHFNPVGKSVMHHGLGTVRAGARGEVNQVNYVNVDPLKEEGKSGLIEGIFSCAPEPYMLFQDGSERKIINLEKAQERLLLEKLQKKENPGNLYEIILKEPDCYNPVSNQDKYTLHSPLFALEGEDSIVGKSVVLQGNEDGNEDDGIACCTLKLVSEEDLCRWNSTGCR